MHDGTDARAHARALPLRGERRRARAEGDRSMSFFAGKLRNAGCVATSGLNRRSWQSSRTGAPRRCRKTGVGAVPTQRGQRSKRARLDRWSEPLRRDTLARSAQARDERSPRMSLPRCMRACMHACSVPSIARRSYECSRDAPSSPQAKPPISARRGRCDPRGGGAAAPCHAAPGSQSTY